MGRIGPLPSEDVPKVHVYTLCWNEEVLLPHFLRHYAWADKVIVYDNDSDDRSRELVEAAPNAELRRFSTGGAYGEKTLATFKNNVWKESRGQADFVIVCDVDEFLYHPDLPAVLGAMRRRGATLLLPAAYQMVSDRPPGPGESLPDAVPAGVRAHVYDKCLLFDPEELEEINFALGAHVCRPRGRAEYFRVPGLMLLHYKFLGLQYVYERHRLYTARTVSSDIARNYSPHHRMSRAALARRFQVLGEKKIDVVALARNCAEHRDWRNPPGVLAARYRDGIRAFRSHDYEEAYELLSQVADWRPDRYRIGAALAVILTQRRLFYMEAEFVLNRTIAIAAGRAPEAAVRYRLAAFYRRSNHPRFALRCAENAAGSPGSAVIGPLGGQLKSARASGSTEQPVGAGLSRRKSGKGKLEIQNLEIHVAHACNLTCESCAHFSNFQHPGVVSIEEAEAWMKPWALRLRPRLFSLLGGEPTIHPRLPEFVLMTRRYWPRSTLRLVTNGFFLHRHPDLPAALREAGNAFVVVSIHHSSPAYLNRLTDNLLMIREWILTHGIAVRFLQSHSHWSRLYHQDGDVIKPFDDRDPRASWEICFGKYCRQLFDGDIYKCAPSAYLKLQDRKAKLGGEWAAYLAYQPLRSDCTDHELQRFFAREDESICGMCPAYRRELDKPVPLDVGTSGSQPDSGEIHPFVKFSAFDPFAWNIENVRRFSRLSIDSGDS